MLAVKGTKLSDNLVLILRSEREALTGGLAGQWQSHMYLSEDAKRSLAHATRRYKIWLQIGETSRIRTLNHTVT